MLDSQAQCPLSHGQSTLPFGTVDMVGQWKSHLWAVGEQFLCVLAVKLLGGVDFVEALMGPGPKIPSSLQPSCCL